MTKPFFPHQVALLRAPVTMDMPIFVGFHHTPMDCASFRCGFEKAEGEWLWLRGPGAECSLQLLAVISVAGTDLSLFRTSASGSAEQELSKNKPRYRAGLSSRTL